MRGILSLAGPLLVVAHCAGADVQIEAPTNDTVVLDSTVTVSGRVTNTDGASAGPLNITLRVGSTNQPPIPVNPDGTWSMSGVALPNGPTRLTATLDSTGDSVRSVVTRGGGIGLRPLQKLRFHWSGGIDEELRRIAKGTLEPDPSPAQQTAFITGVKSRTVTVFRRAYQAVVDLEIVSAEANDVHTVLLLANSGNIFGQSFFDCGNLDPHQTSEVWVGTYADSMIESFETGQTLPSGAVRSRVWAPMQSDDPLQTRIDDISEALGRTSAHEVGHSLGLVGSGTSCGWMRGCDGGHNCDQFDVDFPGTDRFDRGQYIMDPGGKTDNWVRLAEPSPGGRAPARDPATFNRFNASYFAIVHPVP